MSGRCCGGWRETDAGRVRPGGEREGEDPGGYPSPGLELRLIRSLARLDKRDVLEVGCGDGRLTFQYASRARSVVALDPNDEQIQRATMRARALQLEHVRFVVGTAQRPPNGRFDVALFTWSL